MDYLLLLTSFNIQIILTIKKSWENNLKNLKLRTYRYLKRFISKSSYIAKLYIARYYMGPNRYIDTIGTYLSKMK